MRKKKIAFLTDYSGSKTGFAKNAKYVLSYLYNTGKYEIVALCGGITKGHPELERTPWKSVGAMPNSGPELADCNSHPEKTKMYSYGAFEIDRFIKEEKPDVFFGIQDFWGVDFTIKKDWYSKITSVIWTTLDSLPLLTSAVNEVPNIKNFWVWSNFAEKEMHRLGHTHVKTVHGAVGISDFKPLSPEDKLANRKKNNISPNDYIIGFVFRNQLRKSVPNLLNGFRIFKKNNPTVPAKLLLHTHWNEGWNIPKICGETGVDLKDILTTYVCKNCRDYEVKNFSGQVLDCSRCGSKESTLTTGTSFGTTEEQLNEIYSLMDVYCHPFTSGGQEIPIQEAKLCGLITLVTNYSCGEEMCCPEAHSIPLEWTEYREFGSEFIKASTTPESISKTLTQVLQMPLHERQKWGKKARKWVIDNFSSESIGAKIERFLDSAPFTTHDFDNSSFIERDPLAEIPHIEDQREWLKCLYEKILKRPGVPDTDDGLLHWIDKLNAGMTRDVILSFFREVASKDNAANKVFKTEDLFAGTVPQNRILVSINSSVENIYLATRIISGIKKKYPDKDIIVASNAESQNILLGNPNIKTGIIATKEFSEAQFLKDNFYKCFLLDNFSINNLHSQLL